MKKPSKAVNYFHLPRPLWREFKKCLPERQQGRRGGRPACPDRAVMNAIWYVLWTGCQRKAIYRTWFGVSASAVDARFQRWRQLGVFEKMMARLAKHYGKRREVKWKWQSSDSKSCPAPLGDEATNCNPTDRAKQGSKLHLLVDKRGAPLLVIITGANRHDKTAAVDVLVAVIVERPSKPQHLCAEAAYDSTDVRDFVVLEGYTPHIKANRRRSKEPQPRGLGEATYPARRWVVERTLSWLTKRGSIRTRWAKKAANWLASFASLVPISSSTWRFLDRV